MMKVFSSQLRQIHGKVREQLGQFSDARSPSYELMNVAEAYHKMGNYSYAVYAYKKYLEQYPEGNYASRAKELLNIAQRSSMYPMSISPLTYEPEKKTSASSFSTSASSGSPLEAKPNKQLEEMFAKAENFFDSSQYEEATAIYKTLSEYKESKNSAENKIMELSLFRYGLSQKELGNLDESYGILSTYIKKYPKGEYSKESIFNLGLISLEKGEKEKALMLFTKVSNLLPEDQFSERARAKIAELKG